MNEPATIVCPLCALLHLAAARRCDDCGQALHEPVNLGALRAEANELQHTVKIATVFALISITVAVRFTSVIGGAMLFIAPFGWGFSAWWRLRILRRRLPQPGGEGLKAVSIFAAAAPEPRSSASGRSDQSFSPAVDVVCLSRKVRAMRQQAA